MRRSRSSGFGFRPRPVGLLLALGLMAGLWVPTAQADSAPGTIDRVSVATGGAQRNVLPTGSTTSCAATTQGKCTKRTISDDGLKVVFTSRAPNIVDGDNNNRADVFLATLTPGAAGAAPAVASVVRVSVGPGGVEGNGDSEGPSISPDGNWVGFESTSSNLVASDGNGQVGDVFAYHVTDSRLFLASVPASAAQGDLGSFSASIANNGSVSFTSFASNMVPKGNRLFQQVYVRRDPAGAAPKTEQVSTTSGGDPGGAPSKESTISADGLRVAFTSNAPDIGPADATNVDDIFVRDVGSASYTMYALSTGAKAGSPSISSDGDQVAFLAEGIDADARKDVYVAPYNGSGAPNLVSDCTSCTSTATGSTDRPAVSPAISLTGAVVYQSAARYLQDVRSEQVWLGSGSPARVSENATGQADAVAQFPSVSSDGSSVAFTTAATNLVNDDFNNSEDVFVAQMGADPANPGKKKALAITRVSVHAPNTEASGFATIPSSPAAISADGKIVAFESDSSNLVGGDSNGVSDVFIRDRNSNTTTRVSVHTGGGQANGGSFRPAISGDGNLITFESAATNMADGDANGFIDVFLHNRSTGETIRMNPGAGGAEVGQPSRNPSISPNGQFVAFESTVLVGSGAKPTSVIFRYNVGGRSVEMVSTQPPGAGGIRKPAARPSTNPSVANDGSVAFLSDARSLTDNEAADETEAPNATDVFIARPGGQVIKASFNDDEQPANGDSFDPAISADGTKVAFASLSNNMPHVGSDSNPDLDVFLRDLNAGRTLLVSSAINNGVPGGASYSPAINADGTLVAFASDAANLVPGDNDAVADVFLASPANGGMTRVSVRPGIDNFQANGASYTPALSADGLTVAFKSSATNLVDGDDNGAFDTFVRGLTEVPLPCSSNCGTIPTPGGGSTTNPVGGPGGYRFVAADGGIFSFGDAAFKGSAGGGKLNRPIVGMAATPTNAGYWLVASDGGIFAYGDAKFHGSTGDIKLNSPIVGMTSSPTGAGYWFVAADGGIFSFGDAKFFGSMGGKPLNKPIVAMASTKTGKGYWLVASDGGVFSFGDAKFLGSMGGEKLNKPIVGMDASAGGAGYRFVASDGGIFSFGDAKFFGSMGGSPLNKPIVGMAKARIGDGYWLVASDGGIFSYGAAGFHGSTGAMKLNSPIVGMAG